MEELASYLFKHLSHIPSFEAPNDLCRTGLYPISSALCTREAGWASQKNLFSNIDQLIHILGIPLPSRV